MQPGLNRMTKPNGDLWKGDNSVEKVFPQFGPEGKVEMLRRARGGLRAQIETKPQTCRPRLLRQHSYRHIRWPQIVPPCMKYLRFYTFGALRLRQSVENIDPGFRRCLGLDAIVNPSASNEPRVKRMSDRKFGVSEEPKKVQERTSHPAADECCCLR